MSKRYCPDFMIIGFPKCGTTSLAHVLDSLDNVACCKVKEPHFFTPEFPALRSVDTPEKYADLFDANPQCRTFEASTWYAYSTDALRCMLQIKSDLKMVLCLRDPVRMAVSYHQHLVSRGYENIEDIATAWGLEEARTLGDCQTSSLSRPETVHYAERCAIGAHYRNVSKIVPNNQLHVVFLEDMHESPSEVFSEMAEFLDIPGLANKKLPHENVGLAFRSSLSRRIHRLLIGKLMWLKNFPGASGVRKIYRNALYRVIDTNRKLDSQPVDEMLIRHRRAELQVILKVALATEQRRVAWRAETLLRQ